MQFKFTVNKNPVTIEFDVDTIAEGIQVLTDAAGELGRLYDDITTDDSDTGEAPSETTPKKRRRKKGEPDPAVASAPAPVPVPVPSVAPPAAPVPGVMQPPDMPDFLNRAAPVAPVAPAPAPAPVAPARLADKVIADLKTRKAGAADDGKALADWLAGAGLVAAGSTFDEAIAVLQFVKDEQLQPIATALGVTA